MNRVKQNVPRETMVDLVTGLPSRRCSRFSMRSSAPVSFSLLFTQISP